MPTTVLERIEAGEKQIADIFSDNYAFTIPPYQQRCCMDRGGDGIRSFPSGGVRHVSIAKSEYLRWPPRDVRRGALHTL